MNKDSFNVLYSLTQHMKEGNKSLAFRRIYRGNLPLPVCELQLGEDTRVSGRCKQGFFQAGTRQPPGPKADLSSHYRLLLFAFTRLESQQEKDGRGKHIHDKNQLWKTET